MIQGQPSGNPNNGDLQAVGPLGIDVQASIGFDISGVNNAAFAAVTPAAATTSELHTINLTSGAATRVNAIGGGERVRGLTLNANPRATLLGVTTDNRLVTFKTASPGTLDTNVAVTGLQGGETIVGIDVRPANGRLYAVTDAARLYTLDATTGAATMAGMLSADAADATNPFAMLSGAAFGVDFNPLADRLRVVSDTEQNLRANVDTGATTTDATLTARCIRRRRPPRTRTTSPAPTATTLYVIDTQNDRLLTQNPPNNGTLNDVGALGIDATAVNGFEIVGPDTALAVLSTASAPAALYTINLTTGGALLVGNVTTPQASDRITGISAMPTATTPAPDSTVYAVLNGVTLTSFARNAPAQLSAPVAITGLQSGETLIGIDFRPADSLLYAVGSTARLYTIDVATGAATHVAMLAADAADTTDPFTALNGTNFGFDFNPLADRLRIVSDARQNLRINAATGAVTTDANLDFVAPDVVAAAYTQSFARPASTRLLAIDAATGTLQLQNPPNDGVLTTLGRLDPALVFGPTAGFDIVGGDDGLSLAVLQPTGATQSTLYRVNPQDGCGHGPRRDRPGRHGPAAGLRHPAAIGGLPRTALGSAIRCIQPPTMYVQGLMADVHSQTLDAPSNVPLPSQDATQAERIEAAARALRTARRARLAGAVSADFRAAAGRPDADPAAARRRGRGIAGRHGENLGACRSVRRVSRPGDGLDHRDRALSCDRPAPPAAGRGAARRRARGGAGRHHGRRLRRHHDFRPHAQGSQRLLQQADG